MSRKIILSFVFVFVVFSGCFISSGVMAVDYRWSFITGTGGYLDAAIKNKEGSIFTISCTADGSGKVFIQLTSPLLKAGKTDLQIVVNDDSFQFEISGRDGYGSANLSARINRGQFDSLVAALKTTKAQHFTIELPAHQKELSFSTLEANKRLAGLLGHCLDGSTIVSAPAAASFVGNWYGDDPKYCKDKPGQSPELITYTSTRTMGPETSCKILKATPVGSATELSLLCNGEGEVGIRQKELVEVVNGKLHVTYLANGKRITDKLNRCP